MNFNNSEKRLISLLVTAYLVICLIGYGIFKWLSSIKGLDTSFASNILNWTATIFSPVSVVLLLNQWKHQKGVENIAMDSKNLILKINKLLNVYTEISIDSLEDFDTIFDLIVEKYSTSLTEIAEEIQLVSSAIYFKFPNNKIDIDILEKCSNFLLYSNDQIFKHNDGDFFEISAYMAQHISNNHKFFNSCMDANMVLLKHSLYEV